MRYADGGSPPNNLDWKDWEHTGSNLVPAGIATSVPLAVVHALRGDPWFMFARGNDQRIYVASSLPDAQSWTGFQLLVPGPIQTDCAVAVVKHAKYQLFYRGVDRKVYSRVFENAPGNSVTYQETEIPGGFQTDTAVAATLVNSAVANLKWVYVFARNWDQGIYVQAALGGESWGDSWTEVPGGGKTDCSPTAVTFNQRLYLFVIGTDFGIYMNQFDGSIWIGWEAVPGNGRSNVAVTAMTYGPPDGQSDSALYLIARGMDQKPWVNVLT
jgi:hypothetical protein